METRVSWALAAALVSVGGCYVGVGPRLAVGVAGPARGHVLIGAGAETGTSIGRVAAGFHVDVPAPARSHLFGDVGLAWPGSVLHGGNDTTTPASTYSGTGGIAAGATIDVRDPAYNAAHVAVWGGGSRLVEAESGRTDSCEQHRGAVTLEVGVRLRGRSVEIFAAPTYRYQAIACAPRAQR